MAAICRPTKATYAVHERLTVDTTDREDHTFCGILFPVQCKAILPVSHVVIHSVAVRGKLGPLTVWVTNDNDDSDGPCVASTDALISLKSGHWTKVYDNLHGPSYCDYCALPLHSPIVLRPGQVRGIYVHSTLDGDESIVYDNKQKAKTYNDDYITLLPGRAHLSSTAFATTPIWGWGNAWREHREFVGRVSYGVVYTLWNPHQYFHFGSHFQRMVTTLFLCQRNHNSPLSTLPDDVLFYILNMCKWDWVRDTPSTLKQEKRRQRLLTNNNNETQLEQSTSLMNVPQPCLSPVKGAALTHMAEQSDSSEEEWETEDEDDGYQDHVGGSTFSFVKFDDLADSDEDDEEDTFIRARTFRPSSTTTRVLRSHVAVMDTDDDDDDDYEEEDDDEEDEDDHFETGIGNW